MYKSTKQVNQAFREYAREQGIPLRPGRCQNLQPADVRISYCDFVESLRRDGQISEYLANRATYY